VREPVAKGRRAPSDAGRRRVTFGIVVVGMLIAAWVLISSLSLDDGATAQQASASGVPQSGMDDRAVQAAAAPLLEQAAQNPENEGVMIALGNLYYDAARWSSAIEWYSRALEKVPGNTDVRTDLGTSYFYSGDSVRAKEEWLKALDLEPEKIQAHYNLAILHSHESPPNIDEAKARWERVVEIAPDSEQGKAAQRNLDRLNSR
jgi:cytochrome c-type biogenesis protein CcmH/NrfG